MARHIVCFAICNTISTTTEADILSRGRTGESLQRRKKDILPLRTNTVRMVCVQEKL